MAKLYTLDKKLLCERPAVQIGDETFTVDDRKVTVQKVMEIVNSANDENKDEFLNKSDEALKMLLTPKKYAEIEKMELSFKAYIELFSLVLAAATGEEPEVYQDRFQGKGSK